MEAYKQTILVDESLSVIETLISDSPHPIFIVSSDTGTILTSNQKNIAEVKNDYYAGKRIGRVLFNYINENYNAPVYYRNSWYGFDEKPFTYQDSEYVKITLKQLSYIPSEETRNTAKDLIAMLLHRFRSPLTAIQGYSDIISLKSENEEQQQHLGKINKGVQHISDILDEFESLLINENEAPNEMIKISLLVNELLSKISGESTKKRLRFYATQNSYIVGPKNNLLKILHLLTENALEHSADDESSVLISVKSPYCLEITNKGNDISKKELETMFMPFKTTRSDKTGIGLTLAQILAHKSGASIHLKADTNKYITYVLNLPPKFMAVLSE
jgi:signal transduction histidine kinase